MSKKKEKIHPFEKNLFTYSKKRVAALLNISPRTVHYYTDQKLVIPRIAFPKGKGTTRKYSRQNLFEFLIIKELAGIGLSLELIKGILEEIDGNLEWDPKEEGLNFGTNKHNNSTKNRKVVYLIIFNIEHNVFDLLFVGNGKNFLFPKMFEPLSMVISMVILNLKKLQEKLVNIL